VLIKSETSTSFSHTIAKVLLPFPQLLNSNNHGCLPRQAINLGVHGEGAGLVWFDFAIHGVAQV